MSKNNKRSSLKNRIIKEVRDEIESMAYYHAGKEKVPADKVSRALLDVCDVVIELAEEIEKLKGET